MSYFDESKKKKKVPKFDQVSIRHLPLPPQFVDLQLYSSIYPPFLYPIHRAPQRGGNWAPSIYHSTGIGQRRFPSLPPPPFPPRGKNWEMDQGIIEKAQIRTQQSDWVQGGALSDIRLRGCCYSYGPRFLYSVFTCRICQIPLLFHNRMSGKRGVCQICSFSKEF